MFINMGHGITLTVNICKTGRKLANGLNMYDSDKNQLQGFVCPHPGAIYMCITIICKDLLLNCLANQSLISYEASMGRGNQCVHKQSRPHDQDGRHAHIW